MTKRKMPGLSCVATLIATLVVVVALGAVQVQAQNAYGSIVGTVTDSSSAVVPGAIVTITNLGTNEKRTTQSDASGNYRIVNLLPTQYKLEVEKSSYKRVVQSPITVLVDQSTRADASLQVGAASETVEVTTQAPLIQTDSGTLGSEVEGQTVTQMPLNGRNTMNLLSLVPGVVPQGASMGSITSNQGFGHTNDAGWGNFQIGGAIAGQGSMLLDGAPLNLLFEHAVAFVPTQDAIQEFKVATNAASAEFGRYAGGVVEMTTKSGTNGFHGSAYEYVRNTILNANTWGSTTKQAWHQNQYGFSVGGPALKNKAFFFVGYEKFDLSYTSLSTGNVPDANALLAANPTLVGDLVNGTTPDAAGVKSIATLPASQAGCLTYDATTNLTTIATGCLDPTGQLIKNYFAPPTNNAGMGNTNFVSYTPLGDNNYEINARGDINLSSRQRLFLRYTHIKTNDIGSADMKNHNGYITEGAYSDFPAHQAAIGDTITINPTMIADVRLSMTRAYSDDTPPSAGTSLSKLGFNSNWQAIQQQQNVPTLIGLSMNGGYDLWPFHGFPFGDNRWSDAYGLSGSITKIKGNHSIKAGGEAILFDVNALPSFTGGSLTISNDLYANNEWANLLLGDINSFTFTKTNRVSDYEWYQGYYINDTWNAIRKLTVNAGLRWELPSAIAERKNRGTVLLPNATQTINGTSITGILALLGGAQGSAWKNRGTSYAKHNLFSPRLGVAYRLNNNTVLRAGYALAYLPIDLSGNALPDTSTVNSAPTNTQNSSTSTLLITESNPLNGTSINQPTGASDANFLANYVNQSQLQTVSSPEPSHNAGYMQQWNLTVGQQFKGQQSVEIGYAGATGIHLLDLWTWNLNQLSQTNALALAEGTITSAQAQAARPFPAYQGFEDSNRFGGTETYNALQAKYTKRIGTGVINSGYTWSKSIGDTDTPLAFLDNNTSDYYQNYNNQRFERSEISFNITQRWVTSYIIDLPVGKGQAWLNNVNPIVDHIIGGWAVNGITTFQTGQPVQIYEGSGNLYTQNWGAGTLRPDVTPGCSKLTSGSSQSRLNRWFDTSCYKTAGAIQYGATDPRVNYALGTESRVDSRLHGPGIANWDLTAQKTTNIAEGTNLAFRAEFFNIFNRRQFSPPDGNFSDGTFGTITSQKNNPRQVQLSLRFNF